MSMYQKILSCIIYPKLLYFSINLEADMTQKIWILRDTYEPKEGPYWSGHIRELTSAAKKHSYHILEACIDDPIACAPTDLLLFRPTQHGKLRRDFIKKIRAIDAFSINKCSSFPGTKQSFFTLAKKAQIPIPNTWMGRQFSSAHPESPHGFVVKPSRGGQGTDIVFCKTRKNVLREIRRQNKPTVVQEFISLEKVEDIRILMVGTQLCGSMKRVLNDGHPNEFRANLSLGTAHPVPYTPTKEIHALAQRIMEHTQLDFAGIDVIIQDKKPLFLECNVRPGLKGIVQIDSEIPIRVLKELCRRAHLS